MLEVDYDATDEKIRLSYRRLALVGSLSSMKQLLLWLDLIDGPPPHPR